MSLFGGIASAVGSIAGGLIGNAGRASASSDAWDMWNANYNAQKEFAQNGIRWKVADAKAAGLHPLAGLGSGSYFSPTSSAFSGSGNDYSFLADAGQGIGRAIEAGLTKSERVKAAAKQDEFDKARLENMRLQNDNIRQQMAIDRQDAVSRAFRSSQLALRNSSSSTSFPSLNRSGLGSSQLDFNPSHSFNPTPPEVMNSRVGQPSVESGDRPDVLYLKTASGGLAPARSNDAANSLEDDLLGSIGWNIRNRLLPIAVDDIASSAPPKSQLPKGYDGWAFNWFDQAWHPYKKGLDYLRAKYKFWK